MMATLTQKTEYIPSTLESCLADGLDLAANDAASCACGRFKEGCPRQTRVGDVKVVDFFDDHQMVNRLRISGYYRCSFCRDVHKMAQLMMNGHG